MRGEFVAEEEGRMEIFMLFDGSGVFVLLVVVMLVG